MLRDTKSAEVDYPRPAEDEVALSLERDWTKEEEVRAKRKLDLLLMPLLGLGYFCLQLDRGNIANAITDKFMEDVGIDQDQFNVGQQLLSLGIVLTEIPSNMILYRVGPGKWLTLQLFLFGTVSTFQAFQKGYGPFLATRFLLGITESGFIPGGLWTLSTWYTRSESAKRIIVFYFGNQLGQASSKLLAYGILHMRGVAGRPGWFWLFVLMGAFTLMSGILFGLFLPDSFKNPRSTFLPRVNIFTEREIHILRTRVWLDDPMKGKKKKRIGRPAFKKAFLSWRLWVHFLISLANNGPLRAFDTYGPSIVTSFGFPALSSNALASVGLYIQIPVAFAFSYVSDRFNKRGETVMAGFTCHLIGYIFNRAFTTLGSDLRGVRYFGVVWTQVFGTFSHPLNITWMSLACTDSEERALAMTMAIMGGNIAGIYGAQIFRQDDRPLYQRGFAVNISILVAGLLLAVVRFVDDRLRRRKATQLESQAAESDNGHLSDEKVDRPRDGDGQPARADSTKEGVVLPAVTGGV
ncbi:MFS general substrate transporter [Parathielavia appendiculata]|uniref:MFS general substrate transporter n=1 Tax=Parathielavia appendiculata TaxID=2587402 RepID=A0AAN6TP93_9PEZI|nr:MFS general substrate transporter [Parathielavia appendiculata]